MDGDDFWLRRWRSTYATHCLRERMDLATLRDQMGHKDLKSIERYLKALQQGERGEKVKQVWARAAAAGYRPLCIQRDHWREQEDFPRVGKRIL
jgi:hypothetical protein